MITRTQVVPTFLLLISPMVFFSGAGGQAVKVCFHLILLNTTSSTYFFAIVFLSFIVLCSLSPTFMILLSSCNLMVFLLWLINAMQTELISVLLGSPHSHSWKRFLCRESQQLLRTSQIQSLGSVLSCHTCDSLSDISMGIYLTHEKVYSKPNWWHLTCEQSF